MPLNASCFASDKLEERAVELGDGTTQVLYFKHLTTTAFERYAIWRNSADDEVVAASSARLIAMGLCEPDGAPVLTEEQAAQLKWPVALRLVTTLLEVNGHGRKGQPGNALPPGANDGSGTPSP